MLYLFIGSVLLGALGSALLAWRKARVERELAEVKGLLTNARQEEARARSELLQEQSDRADERRRFDDQIHSLRTQRDEALTKLASTGTPGSIADLLRAGNVPESRNP